jgi:hypothetical protein
MWITWIKIVEIGLNELLAKGLRRYCEGWFNTDLGIDGIHRQALLAGRCTARSAADYATSAALDSQVIISRGLGMRPAATSFSLITKPGVARIG